MSRRTQPMTFRQQMRDSMNDLRRIMSDGQSPGGDGRFTVRTLEVVEPSVYDSRAVRRLRRSLNVSQMLFAQLIGVSGSLVRSWELGTRAPAPIARRLLDQVRADPARFIALISAAPRGRGSARSATAVRSRRVA